MNSDKTQSQRIPSPCVRNCCLDDADICLGCYRHIDEIRDWRRSSVDKKHDILKKAEERKNKKNLQS